MVAASQPLAAQAGLDMLKQGGNAIDAAIAAAACLTVVEPTSNGIGGDCFALLWTEGKLHGLNASGPAPQALSIDRLKRQGYDHIPETGWPSVTVPGVPAGWSILSERFGRLPFRSLLQPAIEIAERGFPIQPDLWTRWKLKTDVFRDTLRGKAFEPWFETFTIDGRVPEIGEVWSSPDHARSLAAIAETNGKAFYQGELMEEIVAFSQRTGGYFAPEDFADYSAEWVEPIGISYKGFQVWEIPPNGQGLVALIALNMLKDMDVDGREDAETYHMQIEALKLAFADGRHYIADPRHMRVRIEQLLDERYAAERRKLIGQRAMKPEPGDLSQSGTVYLAAADGEGNMVSFIQSNANGFGSGIVVPGTGISLQNRGANFSFDPLSDNALAPGKRSYHTIIPGFLTQNGEPVGSFGVMGGYMQPQGHIQVLTNMIDCGLNPQAALDAPRWHWKGGKTVCVEPSFPDHIAMALSRKGHDIEWTADRRIFGKGQIILRQPNGVMVGATEPRTDGSIAVW
ncbi:gamma-glutamyltransferase family protein [Paenibacillus sp. MSJ-34]|uniref:gamma-glutamyltransferase family protein n=1 Tax=Paenibacillus sp. MSJ-34 TaxID=2841529 RepID=UPI001C1012F8|nr:gamma-glutamyltransferase family protein [Paenibacillus sp. MSJ-34]MBU5444998.1 gamma-glutamyltransferase family protein [Paenibacillus sp. MSJ-34]